MELKSIDFDTKNINWDRARELMDTYGESDDNLFFNKLESGHYEVIGIHESSINVHTYHKDGTITDAILYRDGTKDEHLTGYWRKGINR